ncbi:protein of unknown function [Taphrina deformans PYCC 5710]|uniref:Fe2OG dioxygenase domain-containing protein n=1 Tax=Taphrina deformans (strain PYCC 5710 / ATCC 11124 / CBS 356.35 / IMI 108563 / JCM 9778 / NBRC 8474) TaxID=1097556 RepID=R4XDW2_TAPDE|nr:protein of unknown function [Taphrina deformans PYCC 5710]|eukprot:CCG83832.1 protein of unknown function [Taphrina deformans PYCC 5710]
MLNLQTVDISHPDSSTATAVTHAARNLGFIYISGHGVSRNLMRKVFALSAQLFKLQFTEKERYKIGPENRGWSCIGSEKLDPETQKNADYKEAFNIAPTSNQALPQVLESSRAMLQEFEKACQDLCRKLCRLLAVGLELESDFFASKHDTSRLSGTIMRLLYYPEVKSTAMLKDEVRAGAHTDYGSLTLLFQMPGQSGLEVRDPDTDTFEAVPAPSPSDDEEELPILVNIADQLTLWTAGLLKSTVHRVTGTYTGDRYSIAYFCHPDDDTDLRPVPQLLEGSNLILHESDQHTIKAGEHLRRRLAATYSY